MSVSIKICGITNTHDAKAALEAGADYLGLIFVTASPRAISVEDAKRIRQECRDAHLVGVFQDIDPEVVEAAYQTLGLDMIQLHGSEAIEDYSHIGPLIQVVQDLNQPVHSVVKLILFDRSKTTPQADWVEELKQFVASHPELPPFWIAGGLTPDTVSDAIEAVQSHPSFCGVDVASGVESAPGKKDASKITVFCDAVRGAS